MRAFAVLAIVLFFLLSLLPQYQWARDSAHDQRVVQTFFSPYGTIDVLDEGQEFFGNGHFFSDDLLPAEREELLHPALLLHPSPHRLLLINAGPGLVTEALKYDSLIIDFVSPDQARIEMEKKVLKNNDTEQRVNFIENDPVRFLNKSDRSNRYDVVLIGGGVPENLASTRFYTSDFFGLVKLNLNEGGFLATGGIEFSPYWTKNEEGILKVMGKTITEVFSHKRIWAGEKVFFVASPEKITGGWWENHPEVLKRNSFLNPDFFPEKILIRQSDNVEQLLKNGAPANTRIQPVMFRMAIRDMSDFWDVKVHWFAIVIGGLLMLGLFVFRQSAKGVFLSGVVLGGMQVVILLLWQLVVGDMYRATGVLFSLFLAGLALGAVLGKREVLFFQPRFFPVLLVMMGVLSIAAVPVLDTMAGSAIFSFLTFVVLLALAVLGGGVFVSGLSLYRGSIQKGAAVIYGADVAGGALGSFLSAIFLVPFTGLVNSGYLLGMALLIAGLLLIRGK